MLSQDKELKHFDEALGNLDLNVVRKMQGCEDSLIPEKKNRRMFTCQYLRDPRINDEWKAKLKSSFKDIMNFSLQRAMCGIQNNNEHNWSFGQVSHPAGDICHQ